MIRGSGGAANTHDQEDENTYRYDMEYWRCRQYKQEGKRKWVLVALGIAGATNTNKRKNENKFWWH